MSTPRILCGHPGLRGDIVLQLPALAFARREYGLEIDMPVHRSFADMIPLLMNGPVNPVIIDGYDDFPTSKDLAFIHARNYAKVLHPMAPHRMERWHDVMHQTAAVLYDYFDTALPVEYQQIELSRWFDTPSLGRTIAFAPFAGHYNPANRKALSVERAQLIVDYLRSKDFDVIKLGGPNEPELRGADNTLTPYVTSVVRLLGCRALIHADTGLGWVASGYKHPQLGLYSHEYYGESKVCNIQPRNPNGQYLSAAYVNEISEAALFSSIDTLLS